MAIEEERRKDFVTLAILTAGGEARIDGDVGSYVKYANAAYMAMEEKRKKFVALATGF